ncbi:hypothetical protein J2S49_000680 [Arcanobacterium wilhelmae]|uniref:Uncharacterized protein n=1 Tax=Arcanobacterium wilhelmae TaxID=1803177 RepID=A0ABT9NA69_9ACTO|nr:hypothetical protein [Arcanobacterium wilhelmae]MDP9800604.1 hypothetical protein [Arcanobacterium wilhelmae]WFN90012.1 hypothetical protein P8A24_07405 [Arcanobacterium wilhelmae]
MGFLFNPIVETILTGLLSLFFLTYVYASYPRQGKPKKGRRQAPRQKWSRELKVFLITGLLFAISTFAGIMDMLTN